MGSAKELLIEMQSELSKQRLASTLGISHEELRELDWNIDTNESNDGLIYNYIIQFSEGCPQKILSKINGLEKGNWLYISPSEFQGEFEDYYDEELNWEIHSTEQLSVLKNHLENIKKILDVQIDKNAEFNLLVMLHTHIISSTEYFLSSIFTNEVINSDNKIRKLIETDPELGEKDFKLKDIYKEQDKLKTTIADYLKGLIFHRLDKIKPMYKSVLDIDFGDISWLFKAVKVRHDCAHRAGYDKDGKKISITKENIKELANKCSSFCEEIDRNIMGRALDELKEPPVDELAYDLIVPFD